MLGNDKYAPFDAAATCDQLLLDLRDRLLGLGNDRENDTVSGDHLGLLRPICIRAHLASVDERKGKIPCHPMLIVIARGINEAVEVVLFRMSLTTIRLALASIRSVDLLLDIDPRGLLKLQIAIAAL